MLRDILGCVVVSEEGSEQDIDDKDKNDNPSSAIHLVDEDFKRTGCRPSNNPMCKEKLAIVS